MIRSGKAYERVLIMSRSSVIEIDGKKYEMYLSTWAMLKIAKRCGGDISKLSEWLNDENSVEQMRKIGIVISDLANGAVVKRNCEVSLDLEQGKEKPLYPEDYFVNIMQPSDIARYQAEIYGTLSMGMSYEAPEGVEIEEKDIDLMEIEQEEKEKKE